jgi:asparagine synthase (glutamine-hydrolysing)
MCGISGLFSALYSPDKQRELVATMNRCMAHRGPDNDGHFQHGQLCLGHRRLSIIDLSADGNQPFYEPSGRYVMVYNGELYNYKELKLELQRAPHGTATTPYFFKTNSDTEVLMAAYLRWGKECLQYLQGMFAFAIYDKQNGELFLVRDRFGVKPLYYYFGKEGLVFASELRAILKSGFSKFTLHHEAMSEYFMYQTIHAPNTIVKQIQLLEPGHYLTLRDGELTKSSWYRFKVGSNKEETYEATCRRVYELLYAAVAKRLNADVPFGAFLSGGIDSSAIVALMSQASTERVRTFNIAFDESEFSESHYARLIAKKFNTVHEEIVLSPDHFLEALPEALAAIDHPGGDGPNTYIVSRAARRAGITMALSGVGGDELFAGYGVFKRMHQLASSSWVSNLPPALRKMAASGYRLLRSDINSGRKADLLALSKIDFESTYPLNRALFPDKVLRSLVKESNYHNQLRAIMDTVPQANDHLLSAVSVAEHKTYLQNVLLRDADQMSMAVSLEVREPFLDHQLIEYVLNVPDEWKYPHTPKKLLTDSLGDLLPPEIIHRPKMGFTLPWEHWMKKELHAFCVQNLNLLSQMPFANEVGIQRIWKNFEAGKNGVNAGRIWHLVALADWINKNQISVD